ncbi:MAG: helix-turn-helix transcriptional regulator [Nitrospinae bacterium]|nr:helix-turn-helix transcriptional regulator [Nitrospinota bacterium]
MYKVRKEKGLTQRKLSLLSGIEQATISKIENLKTVPQATTLKKLSQLLGIKIINQ